MQRHEFASICLDSGDRREIEKVFRLIGWPEGYRHCTQSPLYALTTGYDALCKSGRLKDFERFLTLRKG